MSKEFEFQVGEYAEGMTWRILIDYHASIDDIEPCKHAHSKYIKISEYNPGRIYEYAIVPVIIECKNEGGYNVTHLCLDCLLEAYEQVKKTKGTK